MKRSMFALAALAGAAISAPTPAPAPVAAAPAPVAAPAPAPAAYEPAPAPVVASASTAPVTPATNTMIQSNIAIPGGINALSYVPHRYADKQFAVFQWAPGSTEAWGAFGNWATNFHANGTNGDLGGYLMTPDRGMGVVLNLHRAGSWLYEEDEIDLGLGDPIKFTNEVNTDTALILDGLELVYSQPMGEMSVYANAHFRSAGNTFTKDSTISTDDTSVTEEWSGVQRRGGLTIGARTFAGPNSSAWQAQLTWDLLYSRPQSGSDEVYTHYVRLNGRWGQRRDVESGLIIAYGINPDLQYVDGEDAPDVSASLLLPPNIALELPLFKSWTLKGGATLPVRFTYNDIYAGDNENVAWRMTTETPTGNVGLRYSHGRWAAEAGVSNEFLQNGPYFMSGSDTQGALVSFALAVDLK